MNTILKIILTIIVLSLLVTPVVAHIPVWTQEKLNCEEVAKEAQKHFGGTLVVVMPLQPNGAYTMKGHMLNYIHGWYYDFSFNQTFTTKVQLVQTWKNVAEVNIEVFDLSKDTLPFTLEYKY